MSKKEKQLKELWQFANQIEKVDPKQAELIRKQYWSQYRASKNKQYVEVR